MRYVFLAGGFAGFSLSALAGGLAGREPDLILRDAALACIAGAFLFRWFWSVLVKSLTEAVSAKRAAERAAAEAAAQSAKAGK